MFSDMGPHNVSVCNWLIGQYPEAVTAFAHAHNKAYGSLKDFDAYGMLLKYPSGTIAYTDSTRVTPYGYDARLEVKCRTLE